VLRVTTEPLTDDTMVRRSTAYLKMMAVFSLTSGTLVFMTAMHMVSTPVALERDDVQGDILLREWNSRRRLESEDKDMAIMKYLQQFLFEKTTAVRSTLDPKARPVRTKTLYPITVSGPYKLNNEGICAGVARVSCLIMVHTAPTHFGNRADMRRTWANTTHYSPLNVRVIFLLGTVDDSDTQHKIETEHAQHGDVIQGNFNDAYRNLTHKGVMGYRWITEYCRNADIVLKVDDDAYVNMFKLFEDFTSFYLKLKNTFWCNRIIAGTMPIIRQNSSKWFVKADEYRAYTNYPAAYCSGFAVLLSPDLIPKLYQAAKSTPFFWVDDFFLFGLLATRRKSVTYQQLRGNLTFMHPEAVKCYKEHHDQCRYMVMPAKGSREVDALWNLTTTGRRRSAYGYYYMHLQDSNRMLT
jgi:hypothetical protein